MDHAIIEDHDQHALSKEQQENLNKFKIGTRKENEKFLRYHPEVSCLISDFLHEVQFTSRFIVMNLSLLRL